MSLQDIIEKGETQPNAAIGVLASIAVIILTVILKLLFGKRKPEVTLLRLQEFRARFLLYCLRRLIISYLNYFRLRLHPLPNQRLKPLKMMLQDHLVRRKRRRLTKMQQLLARGGPGGTRSLDILFRFGDD